jgi:hypothetical protein
MMHDDEHLAELVGDALRRLVKDLEPSAELIARVDAMTEAPPRRWRLRSLGSLRRKLLVAIPAPVVAAVVAVVVLFGGSATVPAGAFAVLANGGVRVTISQLMGVAAANRQLSKLHIRNMIVVPMTPSCSNTNMSYMATELHPAPRITLKPTTVRASWTIVLAAKRIAPNVVEMAIGHFTGRIPTCVSSHGTGPAMGSFHP